jgi:hypothetical protein
VIDEVDGDDNLISIAIPIQLWCVTLFRSQPNCYHVAAVTQNADDESLAASQAGQPRGDCPYLKIQIL